MPHLKKNPLNTIGGKYEDNFCGYWECINPCIDKNIKEIDNCNIKFNNIKDYLNFNNVKNYKNCSNNVVNSIDLSSEGIKNCCSEKLITETCIALDNNINRSGEGGQECENTLYTKLCKKK